VDPYLQYGDYAKFAYDNNLINYPTYIGLQGAYAICQSLINAGALEIAFVECQSMVSIILAEAGNINVYDIRKTCDFEPLCYDYSAIVQYMNLPSTQRALGVNRTWELCDNLVHAKLTDDWVANLDVNVPLLLAQPNYTVLVYSGQDDFICNW
jgi:carboxypeptidase C (cathepsin A)